MVISSFISSILVLALGIWAYARLESSMNLFAERQLLIEPNKFSYKMWKDMPVSMYQSFTFFNLTNWSQVKAVGQKPRFVEVGPYVYRTIWSKTDINFQDEDKLVNFGEKKQWHFQPHLSRGHEDDLIWTINTPLMTALALIQNAPVITRNIVSVILDGLGEGAFIKRPIRSLLFEGYSDLIVSVGPLFDRRFANFQGKFAYLYNKNDTVDGQWTVSTGVDDLASLNKITRFQSAIVNMTSFSSGQMAQGLNEVKAECAPAWSLDQSTNGQLFAPFNRDLEQLKLQRQLQQIRARTASKQQQQQQQEQAQQQAANQPAPMPSASARTGESIVQAPKRFFSRISSSVASSASPSASSQQQFQNNFDSNQQQLGQQSSAAIQDRLQQLKDFGKFIFYPDLCRPIHLLQSKAQVSSDNGIEASRYQIDPRVFMNSTQFPSNKCYEMNPRPPLANTLAATLNNAGVSVPNLMTGASSPFALFIPPTSHQHSHSHHHNNNNNNNHNSHHDNGGLFERANHHAPATFLNNALHTLSASANQAADQLAGAAGPSSPIGRLSRVRQLFSNIVSQRMSANPLLPSLAAGPASLLMGSHHNHAHHHLTGPPTQPLARAAGRDDLSAAAAVQLDPQQQQQQLNLAAAAASMSPQQAANQLQNPTEQPAPLLPIAPPGGSDRWITQFRFKWPRGVFSIGQCQLGAPIYVSLPHFLDADEYYLEQVDGLKPNRSLHEFYIDVESTLHSIPVAAKARLQLNIATPELRFRNIPNAMIPVLWQEVTFKIDKPVATLLYWSFTMSSAIYKTISISLLCTGAALLVYSFVGGLRSRRGSAARARILRRAGRGGAPSTTTSSQICDQLDAPCDRLSCATSAGGSNRSRSVSSCSERQAEERHFRAHNARLARASQLDGVEAEGRRSSWQHIAVAPADACKSAACKLHCGHSVADSLDERLARAGVLNHAYASSCNELFQTNSECAAQARLCRRHGSQGAASEPSETNSKVALAGRAVVGATNLSSSLSSPSGKQGAWSVASSHCELMSSPGHKTAALGGGACSRCLFACLRHSPALAAGQSQSARLGQEHSSDISSQLVRQQHQQQRAQKAASDTIGKTTTLSSSRSSNTLDSCSSFYATRGSRKFK